MAALPIAGVKSRVLLAAGERDSSWPAAYSVCLLYDQLEKSKHPYAFKKLIYPEYGHMLPLKRDVMKQVFAWMKEEKPPILTENKDE